MEFARFAVESEAVPIEDAVGCVGVLLDFVNQESRTDRMEAAGGDEDRITGRGTHRMHAIGNRTIGDRRFERLTGHAVFESDIKFSARVAIGDVPHFCFRFTVQRCGKRDWRMHLDREVVARVEDLDEDRKARVLRVAVAENFLAVVGPKFVQAFADEGSAFNDRLLLLTVDDFPCLAIGIGFVRKLTAVDALEFASAPDALHVEGGESDWIHVALGLLESAWQGKAWANRAIDLTRRGGEVGGALEEAENNDGESKVRRGGRWRMWVLGLSIPAVLGGLLWLDGPGVRWLGPMLCKWGLHRAGYVGGMEFEGSITRGLVIKNFHATGEGPVGELKIGRLQPKFHFREMLFGRLAGLRVEEVDLLLRFDETRASKSSETPALDFKKIAKSIRDLRRSLKPMDLAVEGLRVKAVRDGVEFFQLESSALHHEAHQENYELSLGAMTDASGKRWPARNSTVFWKSESLEVEQFVPMPGIRIDRLTLHTPDKGGLAGSAELRVKDAGFRIDASEEFSLLKMDLTDGQIVLADWFELFGIKSSVKGEIRSFSAELFGVYPDFSRAMGNVKFSVNGLESAGWKVDEADVDVVFEEKAARFVLAGKGMGTGISFKADAKLLRDDAMPQIYGIKGEMVIDQVEGLARQLAKQRDAEMPRGRIEGSFSGMERIGDRSWKYDLRYLPNDTTIESPLRVHGKWNELNEWSGEIAGDAMKADFSMRSGESEYQVGLEFKGFASSRMARVLNMFIDGRNDRYVIDGSWRGSGNFSMALHKGVLDVGRLVVKDTGDADIVASGGVDYEWPKKLSTRKLRVEAGTQSMSAQVMLTNGILGVSDLRWLDGKRELAHGSAKFPMPREVGNARSEWRNDQRKIAVDFESERLDAELLSKWFAGVAKLGAKSSGKVSIRIGGTVSDPQVNGRLELDGLRPKDNSKAPAFACVIDAKGRDRRLTLEGRATTSEFPALRMNASMPLRLHEWLERPGEFMNEEFFARLDIPRVDIARLANFVPAAKSLRGSVIGGIDATGTLAKPVVNGKVDLSGGEIVWKNRKIETISGIAASLELARERIVLKGLKASSVGGSLSGGGYLALKDFKPDVLDVNVVARQVPLRRDESLIVRANAELRLSGSWQTALLSGRVGVVDGLFYRDIEILPIGTPFLVPPTATLPRLDRLEKPVGTMSKPFRDWTMDLRLHTEKPFLIRGNVAAGRIDGSLRVRGGFERPLPDGELRVTDFKASLPFSTLTVPSGTARFTPQNGMDPVLEIRGFAEPRPYRVNIQVYGRASNPQMVLISNPPLPDNEIMTLLATGATTKGLEDPQAASSRALQLLAEEFRRGRFVVGKRLRPLLGMLDRVDFTVAEQDPYSSDSFSTATLEITDRWYLSAGMDAEGDSRVFGIWRLTFR